MSWFGIHYLAMVYMATFLPFSIPSSRFIETYGLRTSLLVGVGFSVIGLFSKNLISYSNWWVYFGQTILATAQLLIYNIPTSLSAQWFPSNERIYSTSIGATANTIGIAVGYYFPAFFI